MDHLRSTKGFSGVSVLLVFAVIVLYSGTSFSQTGYPNHPITMVVSYAAGGTLDTMTRALCKVTEKELGQPIVIENRPGATGTVGTNYVLKSKPDGYTLGATSSSTYVTNPHMQKLPFNITTEIANIIPVYKANFGLVVKADAPWKTYEEMIAFAKKNPGKFTYANPGVGSTNHITLERIAMKEGIQWTPIPFKSDSEVALAVLGGNTHAGLPSSLVATPHIKAGKLKLLTIITDTRWSEFPEVPTLLEKGYDFCALSYNFFFAPRDIPEGIRQKLEDVFRNSMKNPSFVEMAQKFQMEIATNFKTGKEFSDFLKKAHDQMGPVIKTLGLDEK